MKRRTQRTGLVSRRVTKDELRNALADIFWLGYLYLAPFVVGAILAAALVADEFFGVSILSGRGWLAAVWLCIGMFNPVVLTMPGGIGSRMRARTRITLIAASVLIWLASVALLVVGEIRLANTPSLDIDPLDPSALATLDALRDSHASSGQFISIALWLAMSLALLVLVLITPRLLQGRRNR